MELLDPGRGTGAKPAAPATAEKPMDLSVKLVRIDDGQFSLRAGSKTPALEKVEPRIARLLRVVEFPVLLPLRRKWAGARSKLDGNAGRCRRGRVAHSLPRETRHRPAGTSTAPGSCRSMAMRGLTGDGALRGQVEGGEAQARRPWNIRLEPVEFEFAADHRLADGSGRLTKGDLRIGAAAAKLGGRTRRAVESTVLHMTLAGDQMPVPELAAMLPSLGVALPAGASLQGGTATVKLAMDGPANGSSPRARSR